MFAYYKTKGNLRIVGKIKIVFLENCLINWNKENETDNTMPYGAFKFISLFLIIYTKNGTQL